jgi:hypothetical protein
MLSSSVTFGGAHLARFASSEHQCLRRGNNEDTGCRTDGRAYFVVLKKGSRSHFFLVQAFANFKLFLLPCMMQWDLNLVFGDRAHKTAVNRLAARFSSTCWDRGCGRPVVWRSLDVVSAYDGAQCLLHIPKYSPPFAPGGVSARLHNAHEN